MDDFEIELKQDFLNESTQLLEDTEQAFLHLESNTGEGDPALLDMIFRLAHNLKGTSRAVGFGDVAEFTHGMEDLILKIKNGEIVINDQIVSVLLECNDHLIYMISTLKEDMDAQIDSTEMSKKVQKMLDGEFDVEDDAPIAVEEVTEKELSDGEESNKYGILMEPDEIKESLVPEENPYESFSDIVERPAAETMGVDETAIANFEKELENLFEDKKEETKAAPDNNKILKVEKSVAESKKENTKSQPKTQSKVQSKSTMDETVRVSLPRIETLNNYVGELIILQAVLNQQKEGANSELLSKSMAQLSKLSKEIQDISMRLRMLPVKSVFTKMQRIVRDTSKALDKKIKLHIEGEETEVDKNVLEQLADPLVHIVRNAVDHGIEQNSEKRESVGKTKEGNIYLNAFHEGNKLVIEVGDDGGGINPDVIRDIAIKRGLISEKQKKTNSEIVNMIFHPGFSTKQQVTEISGRGVGMDVVKTNIENLSGDIHVESHLGKGSLFKISLPLTMAIVDGMVMQVGHERYVIPVGQIHETVHMTNENSKYLEGLGECLDLRGDVIPSFRLVDILRRKKLEGREDSQIAIVVKKGDRSYAFVVDDILRQQQVVIKKLGDEVKNTRGFMGSSILGDGRPALILDLYQFLDKLVKERQGNFTTVETVA